MLHFISTVYLNDYVKQHRLKQPQFKCIIRDLKKLLFFSVKS